MLLLAREGGRERGGGGGLGDFESKFDLVAEFMHAVLA